MRVVSLFTQLKYSTCKWSQKKQYRYCPGINVGIDTDTCVCLWQIIRVFQYLVKPQYAFYSLGKYRPFAAPYLVGLLQFELTKLVLPSQAEVEQLRKFLKILTYMAKVDKLRTKCSIFSGNNTILF